MTDKTNINAEKLRRQHYVERIIKSVNYKGNCDHEDIPSILYDYQEENLDIINRQQAEIVRFKAESQMAEGYADALTERTKTEAIKEFAERLKELIPNFDGETTMKCVDRAIDHLIKEMTEDKGK